MVAAERGGPAINIYDPNESLALTLTLFTEQEASGGHGVAQPLLWVLAREPGLGWPPEGHTQGSVWGDALRCFMMLLPAKKYQRNRENLMLSHSMELKLLWADQDGPVSACFSALPTCMGSCHIPQIPTAILGSSGLSLGSCHQSAPCCRAMGGMEPRLCQGCGWEAKLAVREDTKGKRHWGSGTSGGHVSCAMRGCPGLGGTQQREHSSADTCRGRGRWQGQGGKGAPQGLGWGRNRECGSLTPVPLRYQLTRMGKAQQAPLGAPQNLPGLGWGSCATHPAARASSKLPQTAQWAPPPPSSLNSCWGLPGTCSPQSPVPGKRAGLQ